MRFLRNLWPTCRSANIDSLVFKLYYRCTVLILLLFAFVIACRLVFGYSFFCTSNTYDNPNDFITPYCYTHGPFIITSTLSKGKDEGVMYPGIGTANDLSQLGRVVHVVYYPWVNLFLLVLAILFYLPHLVWKVCEGGLMTRLTSKVKKNSVSEAERKEAIIEIAKYVIGTRGGHILYTGVYVLSEVLNWLVGVLLTVWLVNFFNVHMYYNGSDFNMETWNDFFAYNFPLMGNCYLNRYGHSGDIQSHRALCHMPLNDLYGYIFLFLFAWFILLCVLQAIIIPYRILGLLLPPVRLFLFRLRSGVTDQTLLSFISARFSLGDWFLLTRLQKNLLAHDLTAQLLSHVQQNFNKDPLELEMNDLGKLE